MVKRRQTLKPASSEPQPGPFPYADYVNARAGLLEALQGPSFYALVIGTSGMGKTCLLREISAALDRHRHLVLYLSSSKSSLVGIARFMAQKLHVSPRRSYIETVDILGEAIQAQNSHLLLWVDEADQVEQATLQEIRMLAESHLGITQLFSVVLSGLPQLLAVLDVPTLFPLKRRIGLRWTLAGLRRDELEPFLVHRFGAADAGRIPTSILDELFERTQATPALIDSVVRKALVANQGPIDPEEIRATLDVNGL